MLENGALGGKTQYEINEARLPAQAAFRCFCCKEAYPWTTKVLVLSPDPECHRALPTARLEGGL